MYSLHAVFSMLINSLSSLKNAICLINVISFFNISEKPQGYTGRTYISNIFFTPNITKLCFLNFGPISSSLVRQLHFNTDKCRSKVIRPGCFSIRLLDGSYFLAAFQTSGFPSKFQVFLLVSHLRETSTILLSLQFTSNCISAIFTPKFQLLNFFNYNIL